MGKTEKYVLFGLGAFGVYWFVLRPKQPEPLAVLAYDNSNQSINVDAGISANAVAQIRSFFGPGGTMQNSTNPTQDIANLVASLKSQGYPTAAASAQSLYNVLLVNAHLSASGYAGALMAARVGNMRRHAGALPVG